MSAPAREASSHLAGHSIKSLGLTIFLLTISVSIKKKVQALLSVLAPCCSRMVQSKVHIHYHFDRGAPANVHPVIGTRLHASRATRHRIAGWPLVFSHLMQRVLFHSYRLSRYQRRVRSNQSSKLSIRCNNLSNCSVTVSEELFGNPCEGTSKVSLFIAL